MKRGLGNKTAAALNIHPSTVSRNKERSDVVQMARKVETLIIINKDNDIQRTNGNGQHNANG